MHSFLWQLNLNPFYRKRKRGYEDDDHVAKEPRMTEEVSETTYILATSASTFQVINSLLCFLGVDGWRSGFGWFMKKTISALFNLYPWISDSAFTANIAFKIAELLPYGLNRAFWGKHFATEGSAILSHGLTGGLPSVGEKKSTISVFSLFLLGPTLWSCHIINLFLYTFYGVNL